MAGHQSKHNSHLQVNDLIDDAVNQALARRQQAVDTNDALLAVSDEEQNSISGGIAIKPAITLGIIIVTTGIIAPPTNELM
jgi:hypothetical protein